MSISSTETKMIDISELPKFSKIKAHQREVKHRNLHNNITKLFLIITLITIGAGRYFFDRKFDLRLEQDHQRLDNILHRLTEMKSQAFINNNYKNLEFRKKYMALHNEQLILKQQHIYDQTNTSCNIFKKNNGPCPECEKYRNMGLRIYE